MMIRNARDSLRIEAGCHRFDVLRPESDPDQILLYEIYSEESAFEEHCRMPHFLRFEAESKPLVQERDVIRAGDDPRAAVRVLLEANAELEGISATPAPVTEPRL